jgi:hypothetical protein
VDADKFYVIEEGKQELALQQFNGAEVKRTSPEHPSPPSSH